MAPASGSWDKLRYHLLHIWCRGNEGDFQTLMAWFAHLVRKPSEKPAFALHLRGHSGFRTVAVTESIFGPVFGSGYSALEKPWQLAGRFRTADKNLAVLAVGSGKYACKLLQDRGTPFPPKTRLVFIGFRDINAFAMMLSGRIFTLTPSDEKNCGQPYFDALLDEIENGGRDAFLHALSHYGYGANASYSGGMTDAARGLSDFGLTINYVANM